LIERAPRQESVVSLDKDQAESQRTKYIAEKIKENEKEIITNKESELDTVDKETKKKADIVVGNELSEAEVHAEKMVEKYISKERRDALRDTPEELAEKKRKAEERQKVKDENAEKRRKSKELKAEEKRKSLEEKQRQKQKNPYNLVKLNLENSTQKKADKSVKEESTDLVKQTDARSTCYEVLNEDQSLETPTKPKTENQDQFSELKDVKQIPPSELKTEKLKSKPKKKKKKTSEEDILNDVNEETKLESSSLTVSVAKKKKIEENYELKPIPKLVKPDIPNISTDELMKSTGTQSDRQLPNLLKPKPKFKAPKKKKSSCFQAPTKNKMSGGKRPHSVALPDLEISIDEPRFKKANITKGILLHPFIYLLYLW